MSTHSFYILKKIDKKIRIECHCPLDGPATGACGGSASLCLVLLRVRPEKWP